MNKHIDIQAIDNDELLSLLDEIEVEELFKIDNTIKTCSCCCSSHGGGKARYE